MSLTNISNRLSEYISQESSLNNEQKEVLSYAVETVLLSIVGTIMLIIVSSFFQAIIPTLIAAFFGGTLRRLSGGAHFNTPLKCLIFSTLIYTCIGVISEQLVLVNLRLIKIELLMMILLVLCLIITGVLAPVESKGKPIHSKTLRIKLKVFSVIFIFLVLIFIMYFNFSLMIKTSAVLGITYQSITLLPLFNDRREVIT